MATRTSDGLSLAGQRGVSARGSYGIDTTTSLDIGGTKQRVRLTGARGGPPVLIVQGGPGLPLLNEIRKFQQRLYLERHFSVAYWDQRGCGPASSRDVRDLTLETQIDDASTVVRWLARETGQRVVLLGISIGATIALQAAARDASNIKAVVAVSIDTHTPASDATALSFLQDASIRLSRPRLARAIEKLGRPPYELGAFQARARLLADSGGVEYSKRFGELLGELLFSLIRSYGVLGAVATLRNMNAVQRRLLPEVATLNLFASWPRPSVPVHYIFGENDALTSAAMVQRVSGVIAQGDTLITLPNAGHMVHFDQPDAVRSTIASAHAGP